MARLLVPASVVLLVDARSGGRCELCGVPILGRPHLHHRQPRGMGSSTGDPHAVENLLSLHERCHLGRVERKREEAYRHGWLVRHGFDPATVPVFTSRGWLLPSADGAWTAYSPDESELLTTHGAVYPVEPSGESVAPRRPRSSD